MAEATIPDDCPESGKDETPVSLFLLMFEYSSVKLRILSL